MKKFLNEFKEFALRGNVVDMAIGVIVGGAFGKIVSSLVEDVAMPAFSVMFGIINFADLSVSVVSLNAQGQPIVIKYGLFLQNVFNFLIVALCIFLAVKAVNLGMKKKEEAPEEAAPPAPSKEELLLAEIRDLLKEK